MTLIIALFLTTGLGACRPHNSGPFPDNTPLLRVTFLDVGQGDSTIIEGPTGRVVIVDGGGIPGTDEREQSEPGSRVVVPYLRSRGISTVDLIVPTHPDDDHVQGLIAVVSRLDVRGSLVCGYGGDSGSYNRLLELLKTRRVPVYTARRGQTVDLGGGAVLEILSPPNYSVENGHSASNNHSIVLRVVYGKSRFLLTGDAEQEAEADIIKNGRDLSADVYKAGHHGSRGSSSPAFLNRVHPRIAIISCGKDNSYGHPHKETLTRFAERNIRVFRTDQSGAIVVTTDGKTLHFAPTVKK